MAMFRAKLIVIAALVFLLGQIQCAAACASDCAQAQNAPCCPHHSHQTPRPCAHQSVVASAHLPQFVQIAVPASFTIGTAELKNARETRDSFPVDPSPPGCAGFVLRI